MILYFFSPDFTVTSNEEGRDHLEYSARLLPLSLGALEQDPGTSEHQMLFLAIATAS